MDEPETGKTPSRGLKELLAEATKQVKLGEARKRADAKLQDLQKNVEKEAEAYRAARAVFVTRWTEQDAKFETLRRQLESCHKNWREHIEQGVCIEVLKKVSDLRADLDSKIGEPRRTLDYAKLDFQVASLQLDAWKGITKWIGARLDEHDKIFKEICTLDNCEDRLFALYRFFFDLLPEHQALNPAGVPYQDPEQTYCASVCGAPSPRKAELPGYPWLIETDDYDGVLADKWGLWAALGEAETVAQVEYDGLETIRAEWELLRSPDEKRKAARAALRRRNAKHSGSPKGESGPSGGTPPPRRPAPTAQQA